MVKDKWVEKKLNDIAPLQRGFDLPKTQLVFGDYPVVYSNGIENYHNIFVAKGPGVVTGRSGTIGKVTYVEEDYWPHNTALWVTDFKGNNPKFIYYLYNYIHLERFGTGSGVPTLNRNDVHAYAVYIPPTKADQTAIATALSDADALIQSIEKLIVKKRNIKHGAMQELLIGKKRLPGFSGKWEVKKFSEICWFQEGPGLRNWQFTTSGMKVINVTNLENGYLNLERTDRYISLEEFNKMYQHFEIDDGDIVVASSGNSYAKVAVAIKQDLPLMMNTSVIRFKPLRGLDYYFLLTFLKSNHFKEQIDLLITGGAQPNFGPAHLKKIEIKVPPTKDEQTTIAAILSDMDAEIIALETKLAKYKQIKQGMMQNLLTGKIRLI